MSRYISFPLDNTDYTAEAEQLYGSNRTNGVYGRNDEFIVTVKSGMKINVTSGRAWINFEKLRGFIFGSFEDEEYTISIGDATLNRIDRVIIRYDIARNTTYTKILQGAPAANPNPPAITRNTTTYYDLCVAEIRVNAGTIQLSQSMISDKRLDESLCGIVRDGLERIPTDALIAQWQSWFNDISTKGENDWNNWYSLNTQMFGNQFTNWFNSQTGTWTAQFNNWFQNLQNQLNTNQATNLQNQINQSNDKINDLSELEIINGNRQITINGTKDGYLNEIVIKGKTNGGFNSQNNTPFAIISSGESENNIIKITSNNSGNTLQDRIDISLPMVKGLKSFDENIYDTIYKKNGNLTLNQKLEGVTLNGSEEWKQISFPASNKTLRFTTITKNKGVNDSNVVCDKFKSLVSFNNDTEHVYYSSDAPGVIAIYINKDKLETQDIVGFKKWLQTNNVTVIYQLSNPIITELNSVSLKSYNNITNIIQENQVCGDINITYDTINKTSILNNYITENRKSLNELTTYQYFEPTLLSGWVDTDGNRKVRYWKDKLNQIHLIGEITGGLGETELFWLPKGYYKDRQMDFACIQQFTEDGPARVRVRKDGCVIVYKTARSNYINFGEIIFQL